MFEMGWAQPVFLAKGVPQPEAWTPPMWDHIDQSERVRASWSEKSTASERVPFFHVVPMPQILAISEVGVTMKWIMKVPGLLVVGSTSCHIYRNLGSGIYSLLSLTSHTPRLLTKNSHCHCIASTKSPVQVVIILFLAQLRTQKYHHHSNHVLPQKYPLSIWSSCLNGHEP